MTLRIRDAGEHDVDPLMTVMDGAFDAQFGEAWSRVQLLGTLAGGDAWARIALVGAAGATARPAGFSLCRRTGPDAELLLVGVVPAMRGQGIGAALVRLARTDAARRGAEAIFLEVRDGNDPALALYRAARFVAVGRRRDYYSGPGGTRYDAVTMRCDLTK